MTQNGVEVMWLIEYHHLRKGREHFLHDSKWCRGYVTDSSMILGNSKQIGNDCGLHTIILPILLQEGLFLQVFGNTEREKKLFSIEMRRRVVLSLYFGVLYFEPDVQKILELEEKYKRERTESLKKQGGPISNKRKRRTQHLSHVDEGIYMANYLGKLNR